MKWYIVALMFLFSLAGCQAQPEPPDIIVPQVVEMVSPEVEEPEEVIVEEPVLPDVGEYFTLVPLSEEYVEIFTVQGGYAAVKMEEGYGIIDTSGQLVSPVYEEMRGTVTDKAIVTSNGKKGLIAADGTVLIPCWYDEVGSGGNLGYYRATLDGKTGIVNEKNQICLPLEYEDACFNGFGFCAQKDGKWALIGENGENLTKFIYDYLPAFWEEDVNIAWRDGKWGLLDRTGVERSSFLYDTCLGSKEKRFALREGEICYILNEQGVVLSSGSWSEHDLQCIRSGDDGIEKILDWDTGTWVPWVAEPKVPQPFTVVENQYYEGVVNEAGKEILPMEFHAVDLGEACFYVNQKGKYGAYGLDGQVLIPPQYKGCQDGGEGYFRVFDGEKCAVFGADGTQLTDFIFDEIPDRSDCLYFYQGTAYVEIDGSSYFLQTNTAIPQTPVLPEIPEGIVTWAEAVDALRSIGGDVDGITTSDKKITVGEFLTLLETTTGESADDWLKIHGQERKEEPMEGSAMIGILCDTTLFPQASLCEIAGFVLGEPYESAPASQRNLMTFDGVVGTLDEFSDIVQYSHKGLIVHVVQMSQEEAEPYYEELAGQIVSVYITDDSYDLPRNLTVGNTLDDFWNVYGYDCDSGTHGIRLSYEGEILTALGFSGLYDPACPLIFPYLVTGPQSPSE